jgi:hypothetical protein
MACAYCGLTIRVPVGLSEELALVREQARAAQELAMSTRRDERRQARLVAFWQNAFVPTTLPALLAALDVCAGNASNASLHEVVLQRASAIEAAVRTHPDATTAERARAAEGLRLTFGAVARRSAAQRSSTRILVAVVGLVIALVVVLAVLAPGRPGASSRPMVDATIAIHVEPKKADGKDWDFAGGLPDIGFCLSVGETRTCYPGGKPKLAGGSKAVCQDALECTTTVQIPADAREIVVEVIDIDIAANDVIGSGTCRVGETCRIGQATVTITR